MRTKTNPIAVNPARRNLGIPSTISAVSEATVATIISFAFVDLIFFLITFRFAPWRTFRTEFAFSLPSNHFSAPLIYILAGTLAIDTKRWIVPALLGFIALNLNFPTYGWSGPPELLNGIQPLIFLRMEMLDFAMVLNAVLIYFWIKKLNAT